MGMNRSTLLVLLVLTVVAFILRIWLVPTHLFFGPEQGRDFFETKKIIEGNFTLIGAKTDFEGVFHGPIQYYLAAIPFWVSHGNPLAVVLFFAIIQSLTVFAAYFLGKEISGKQTIGIISAILFAVSYGVIVYSRWLSQPPLAIPISFLFLLFLFRFLKGNKRALFGIAIFAGLLGQVQFINYLFVPLFLIYVVLRFRKKISRNMLWVSTVLFLITAWGNFFLFDVRNNFLILRNIMQTLFQAATMSLSLGASMQETGLLFIRWLGMFVGTPTVLSSLLFLVGFVGFFVSTKRKQEILFVWIFLPLIILTLFRRGALDQLFVMIVPAIIVLTAIMISAKKGMTIFLTTAFVFLNVWQVFGNFQTNRNIFFQAPQPEVRYSDQLAVVDEIYTRIGEESFEIQAYTIPHAWQDGWQYLFWYRGTTRYGGNLPVEHGGYRMFVIIQNDRANRTFQENWYRDIITKLGSLTDQFTIGEYTVEERLMYL